MPRERPNLCCVHCGGRMQTKDSRPTWFREQQAVRRRRGCGTCGWRITTYEVMDVALIDIEARLSAIRKTALEAYHALGALLAVQSEIPDGLTSVTTQDDAPVCGPHPAGE